MLLKLKEDVAKPASVTGHRRHVGQPMIVNR